ncbi:MAG: hypothetical protein K0U20_08295 [Proteobacteria bacterium]|nr:hypothetical protein [Pseudomonadota bacterium]
MTEYGIQQQLTQLTTTDEEITTDAKVTFFKRNFQKIKRHAMSNAAYEIRNASFGKSFFSECKTSGDLVSDTWLTIDLKPLRLKNAGLGDTVHWSNALGHAMLEHVQFCLENDTLQTLEGRYMEIKHEFEKTADVDTDGLILRSRSKKQLVDWAYFGNSVDVDGHPVTRLRIRLPFYYTQALNLAYPNCAVYYGAPTFKGLLRHKRDLLVFSNPDNTALDDEYNGDIINMWTHLHNVFVTDEERIGFSKSYHTYTIKNVSVSKHNEKPAGAPRVSVEIKDFRHPVSALYGVIQKESNIEKNDHFNFELTEGRGDSPYYDMTIKLGNYTRESLMPPEFYEKIQPAKYWKNTPSRPIIAYSFAQFPREWFPSGTCNFTRVGTSTYSFNLPRSDRDGNTFGKAEITFYCEFYNFILIEDGGVRLKYA